MEVVPLLLAQGADKETENFVSVPWMCPNWAPPPTPSCLTLQSGETPLDLATSQGCKETAALLLPAEYDSDQRQNYLRDYFDTSSDESSLAELSDKSSDESSAVTTDASSGASSDASSDASSEATSEATSESDALYNRWLVRLHAAMHRQ